MKQRSPFANNKRGKYPLKLVMKDTLHLSKKDKLYLWNLLDLKRCFQSPLK